PGEDVVEPAGGEHRGDRAGPHHPPTVVPGGGQPSPYPIEVAFVQTDQLQSRAGADFGEAAQDLCLGGDLGLMVAAEGGGLAEQHVRPAGAVDELSRGQSTASVEVDVAGVGD